MRDIKFKTMNLKEKAEDLNKMILNGQGLEAFEKYYHEDVVMQENNNEPTIGKSANRERELQAANAVQEFHGAELKGLAVGDDLTMAEWSFDITYQGGHRVKMNQVTVQRWKDGQIIHEHFYYPTS